MQSIAFAPAPVAEPQTHLTSRQRGVLRAILVEHLQSQRDRAVQATVMLQEFSGFHSPADRETAREQLAGMLVDASRLEAALERMESSDSGTCVDCSRPLPFERLEAIPDVQRCMSCLRF